MWEEAREEVRLRLMEYVTRSQQPAGEAERACLTHLSIRRMKQWIEDDEDALAAAEKEKRREQILEAKRSHDQFVSKKDRCVGDTSLYLYLLYCVVSFTFSCGSYHCSTGM